MPETSSQRGAGRARQEKGRFALKFIWRKAKDSRIVKIQFLWVRRWCLQTHKYACSTVLWLYIDSLQLLRPSLHFCSAASSRRLSRCKFHVGASCMNKEKGKLSSWCSPLPAFCRRFFFLLLLSLLWVVKSMPHKINYTESEPRKQAKPTTKAQSRRNPPRQERWKWRWKLN